MSVTRTFYLPQADECARDAQAPSLPNLADRLIRNEAARRGGD